MFKKITETRKGVKEYLKKAPPHYAIRTANALLTQKQLAPILKKLPNIVNAPDEIYEKLYKQTIMNLADCIQGLPAVKTKAFNYHGGFLDLSIERTYTALLSYRKEYPIKGINPEQMPPKLALWTYALFTVALFYGIGEICATYWVSVTDEKGRHSKRWSPFQNTMANFGSHYRFSFESVNRDNLAAKSAPILARQLIPAEGFNWIANDREVFEYWLNILQNVHTDAGILARFVLPTHDVLINQDPRHPGLLGFILPAAFDLEDEFDIEKSKFLDKENEEREKARAEKEALKEKEELATHIPASSIGVAFTDLDLTGLSTTEIGELFINWLRVGVLGHGISVNRSDSKINVVQEGLLLLHPEIFMEFVKANPQFKTTWQEVSKSFTNSGYAMHTPSKIQNYTSSTATSTSRQFNLPGAKAAGQQAKGILVDPTLVFNANIIPAVIPNVSVSVPAQSAYPQVSQASANKAPIVTR